MYISKERQKEYSVQKPCTVCNIIKPKSEFNLYQQKCKVCEDLRLYKCCKCVTIKHYDDFEKNKSRTSGLSSRCKKCSYSIKKTKPRKITITRRSRMFFKDCLKRLNQSKVSDVYNILGYTKEEFMYKFPTIPKGYDIDHCIPLSWFKEDTPISISCALSNLQLLEHSINIKKNNLYYDEPTDNEYFIKSIGYIREKYLHMFKI
jgi:hypothetical protein